MESIKIESLAALKAWVQKWTVESLGQRDIILLEGAMGVGKSQLVQFLVEELSEEQSCSPSYAIHNVYTAKNFNIDHLDLYRVEDEEDLESTGFWDLFNQDKAVVCIEWADRMDPSVYPPKWKIHQIQLEKVNNSTRQLNYNSWIS